MIPGSGRSAGEGNGYPLQYSGLENSMERGALWAPVHEAAEFDTYSRTLTRTLVLSLVLSYSHSYSRTSYESDSYSHTSAGTAVSGSQFRKLSVITLIISGLRLRALFSLHPRRSLCFPHLKVQICGGFCEPRHTVG